MEEQIAYQEENDNLIYENCVEKPAYDLTAEQLLKIIVMAESVSYHIMEVDSNIEPSLTIRQR